MRAFLLLFLGGFLVAPVSANAAFPGKNGLIAWNTASNAGPGVRAGTLDGRAKRRIGLLATSPPTAAEQSDGTVLRRLPLPQAANSMFPSWSPTGKWIAFAADLFEAEPTLEYRIATVGANGGPVRVHWKSRRFISALDWQPR